MKIQSLAVIFIIIVLPMSILLSEYLQTQINTLNMQTSYDSRLTGATYDAIRAFQLNALNSSTNDLTGTKIRDIEASAKIFLTSIANNFGESGLDQKGIQSFVPAVVYCLYDGYYIYSPYKNDISGEILEKIQAAINLAQSQKSIEPRYANFNPRYKENDETLTGIKPYIYYSCRYKKESTDVIITYSLDNYVVIQGMVGGTYRNESGYVLNGVESGGSTGIRYNGVDIPRIENLSETFFDLDINDKRTYPYAKINGTKYYYDEHATPDEQIFYMQNGKKMYGSSQQNSHDYYLNKITNNDSAYKFYEQALSFTNRIKSGDLSALSNLKFDDAVDVEGNNIDANGFNGETTIFQETGNTKAEDTNSNFTEHRTAVIRYAIEKNLTTAIANYNKNFASNTAAFAMPNLSETDWYKIIDNISMITFLQGLPIGGKIYNGYSVVTNNKNEDFVSDESIYITSNGQYHRIGDEDLYGKTGLMGFLNLDFERHSNDQKNYYYPREEEGCYTSIVNQTSISNYDKDIDNKNDDLYEYLDWLRNKGEDNLLTAYYTALGREKYGMFRYIQLDPNDKP